MLLIDAGARWGDSNMRDPSGAPLTLLLSHEGHVFARIPMGFRNLLESPADWQYWSACVMTCRARLFGKTSNLSFQARRTTSTTENYTGPRGRSSAELGLWGASYMRCRIQYSRISQLVERPHLPRMRPSRLVSQCRNGMDATHI